MKKQFEVEFGSTEPIRFWNPVMYDSEGNEVLCKCGKPAEMSLCGKSSVQSFCKDCCPRDKE